MLHLYYYSRYSFSYSQFSLWLGRVTLLKLLVGVGTWTVTRGSEATLVMYGNIGDSRCCLLHLLYFINGWEVRRDHTEGNACLLAEEELVGMSVIYVI